MPLGSRAVTDVCCTVLALGFGEKQKKGDRKFREVM